MKSLKGKYMGEEPKIEGWGLLEQALEDERTLYKDVILETGYFWDKTWLPAYSHDDRGYEIAGPIYQTISNNFQRLKGITDSVKNVIPAMEKELMIMERLEKDFMGPIKELIYTKVPNTLSERGNKKILFPEEWVDTTDKLSRVRTYIDYRNGLNFIRYWYFVYKKPVRDLVKDFKGPLIAFERKWEDKYYTGTMEEFGFVTFCGIDSHDETVLPKVLKEKDPKEILLNEIPERGLERVIFNPAEDVRKKIEHSLRIRTHKDTMCTVNSLRIRLDRKRFKEYTKEILRLCGLLDYLSYII